MKKSFLWAFSLVICLVACLTACDNDSAVDESSMDISTSIQKTASATGMVDFFDSIGNKIATAPYEITYPSQDLTSHSTRTAGLDSLLDEIYFDVAPQDIYYTSIRHSGPYTYYSGYVIATVWGTMYLGNPDYYKDYYHQEMTYPKKKGYKIRFDYVVGPFWTDFVVWGRHQKLFYIHCRTDTRILVNTSASQHAVQNNIASGLFPEGMKKLRPEYIWQTFLEMTDYESGEPYHYKGYIYY